jgi:hypothetical protein
MLGIDYCERVQKFSNSKSWIKSCQLDEYQLVLNMSGKLHAVIQGGSLAELCEF